MTNCTLYRNSVAAGQGGRGGDGGGGGAGGGADGDIGSIGGNAGNGRDGGGGGAGGTAAGGALCVTAGTASVVNCTLADNQSLGGTGGRAGQAGAAGDPGGGRGDFGAPGADGMRGAAGVAGSSSGAAMSGPASGLPAFVVAVANSIISTVASDVGNCAGRVTDAGHNLNSDASLRLGMATASRNNTDPRLAPLAYRGGPTAIMGLYVGSPAIDTADPGLAPATDERGVARPQGAGYDIGAFEGNLAPDTVAPSVAIEAPRTGSVGGSFPVVAGMCRDDQGVRRVDLSLQRRRDGRFWNGNTWQRPRALLATHLISSARTASWTRDASLGLPAGSDLTDGVYTLQATAYDWANNQSTPAISNFTVDATPPTFTFLVPTDGQVRSSLSGIRGVASDNLSGVAAVALTYQRDEDGRYWDNRSRVWSSTATLIPLGFSSVTQKWVLDSDALPVGSNLPDGGYTLRATATDRVGNSRQVTITYVIAQTPPTVTP